MKRCVGIILWETEEKGNGLGPCGSGESFLLCHCPVELLPPEERKFGDGCWWMQCELKPLSSLVWGTLPVPPLCTVFLAGLGKDCCVRTHGSCRGPPFWKILKLEDVTCGKLLSTAGSGGLDSHQSCYCAHGRDDGCR